MPATRYQVMVMDRHGPRVICRPLTAAQAAAFVQGCADRGWYIEKMPAHIRPAALAQ